MISFLFEIVQGSKLYFKFVDSEIQILGKTTSDGDMPYTKVVVLRDLKLYGWFFFPFEIVYGSKYSIQEYK